MDKWHIIYTQTHKEKYLDYQIKNLGLKTYLPLYKRSVSHSHKVIEKTYSLFPRYLFVKFDVNKSTYNHLKKLHGLEKFIRSDSKLVTIRDEIIKKIKDKEDEGGYVDITKFIDKKIESFLCYKSEVKDYPHPRSKEGIKILADVFEKEKLI